MSGDQALATIQALQYVDKPAAEAQLLGFIEETFPGLGPARVELRPSAVSLNSFNGYVTLRDGRRLFFKTHVEPGSIVSEYYNSRLMAGAGYPIIQPLYASTTYGRQFLIYDLISAPSVFDLMREADQGQAALSRIEHVRNAQAEADRRLGEIYRATLGWQTPEEAEAAPVHQLLYHRLHGSRYRDFYMPGGSPILPLNARWVINGRRYHATLADLIDDQERIAPAQAGPAVVGHGDAHNGNVFFIDTGSAEDARLVYFDPAFAGRHHPLLDLAKPLFHNVFATWMYHPADYVQKVRALHVEPEQISIEFDETPPADRLSIFFESKIRHTLIPTALTLFERGWLRPDWRDYLKRALFCCPLLTMNLYDPKRFPEPIRWLGLAWAVIMGADADGPEQSALGQALGEVQAALDAAPRPPHKD